MARALRSSSLRLRSMSSISRSFCKGQQGELVSGLELGEPERGPKSRSCSQPACPHVSGPALGLGPTARPSDASSYLGDLGEDDGSVLLALSQGLHGGQEVFPLLDFLHHCTGEGALSARAGGPVGPARSPPGAHILQSGPARGSGPAVPEVPFSSVPLCPSPWQRGLGVSASPSPGLLGAQKWPGRVRGAPPSQSFPLRPRPFSPGGT